MNFIYFFSPSEVRFSLLFFCVIGFSLKVKNFMYFIKVNQKKKIFRIWFCNESFKILDCVICKKNCWSSFEKSHSHLTTKNKKDKKHLKDILKISLKIVIKFHFNINNKRKQQIYIIINDNHSVMWLGVIVFILKKIKIICTCEILPDITLSFDIALSIIQFFFISSLKLNNNKNQ